MGKSNKTLIKSEKPGSKLLRIVGIILFILTAAPLILLVTWWIELINYPPPSFTTDKSYYISQSIIILGIGAIFIILGLLCLRYSKREDISEYKKVYRVIIPHNFVMILISIIATLVSIEEGIIFVILYLAASIMFIFATVYSVKKEINPANSFMIIGGILTLPLGIVSIVAANYLKKISNLKQ